MKTEILNYKEIKKVFDEEYVTNSPEACFVSNYLWTLPEKWIKGLADFVRANKDQPAGFICAQILHDIGGYVNKDIGFSPRCFRGGSVWDKK